MFKLLNIVAIIYMAMPLQLYALDKNGNFESIDEQNKYIATVLKKMAVELNSQTPIMLDEQTQFKSAIALDKTISFSYSLVNLKSSDVPSSSLKELNKTILNNMNELACKVKATRDLIDLGVSYVYLYFGNDDRLITRVVLKKYICKK